MIYTTIQFPIPGSFSEMTPKQHVEHARWMISVSDERIAQLEAVVRASAGFETWIADNPISSFIELGPWFTQRVSTRPRTIAETQSLNLGDLAGTEFDSGTELTEQTYSLCFDIGLYFARVMMEQHPSLKWAKARGGKKSIDFGQPVLTGFGRIDLNPITILVTAAWGATRGRDLRERFQMIYSNWAIRVTGKQF
jgi:hypothetical protein